MERQDKLTASVRRMRYARCFIANISSHLLMHRKGVFVACMYRVSRCIMIIISFIITALLYMLYMSAVALRIVFTFFSDLLLEARKRLQRKWKLLL